ncbi:MAG: hypothetical protein ACI90V_001616 [Bacillariaceae sp.]|jgi:hypothetical protein
MCDNVIIYIYIYIYDCFIDKSYDKIRPAFMKKRTTW